MDEKVKELLEMFIHSMCSETEKGIEHMDEKETMDIADIIKDLSMAYYYITVAEAMEDGVEPLKGFVPATAH